MAEHDDFDHADVVVLISALSYLAAPIALAWQTNDLNVAALVVLPVLAASWLQDWRSTMEFGTYEARLTIFDVLSAANYVALARSLEAGSTDDWYLSHTVYVHWTLLFVIYIVWNWRAAAAGALLEAEDRRKLTWFSIVEIPAILLAAALAAMTFMNDEPPLAIAGSAVGGLMLLHLGIIVAWRRLLAKDDDVAPTI